MYNTNNLLNEWKKHDILILKSQITGAEKRRLLVYE